MTIRVTRRPPSPASPCLPSQGLPGRQRHRWATVVAANPSRSRHDEQGAADMKEQTAGAVEIQVSERPARLLARHHRVGPSAPPRWWSRAPRSSAVRRPVLDPRGPYIWRDPAHIRHALPPADGGHGQQLIAERSLRMNGANYYGTRHGTSGSRPVHTVDDMKGFKLRIPEVTPIAPWLKPGRAADPAQYRRALPGPEPGAGGGEENPRPTIQASSSTRCR